MTEAEAWREIARRIVEGEWGWLGLCYEIARLKVQQRVADDQAGAMALRVEYHVESGASRSYPYAYVEGTEPEARALAALWLALEAEEEAA